MESSQAVWEMTVQAFVYGQLSRVQGKTKTEAPPVNFPISHPSGFSPLFHDLEKQKFFVCLFCLLLVFLCIKGIFFVNFTLLFFP